MKINKSNILLVIIIVLAAWNIFTTNGIRTDVDANVNNVTKNITIIKNQTHEKIDSVNNYNFSDLEKFFSDRYKN